MLLKIPFGKHFFNRLVLLLLLAASLSLRAADVTGAIRLVESTEGAVRKQNDFSGVIVWLTPLDQPPPPPPSHHAVMLQKNKRFVPHILPVQTGSSVDFPNLDPIFHNAFSNYDGQSFDVALYPPGSSRTVRFDRPGIVRVFCNIHPFMSAIIVVVDSDNVAATDATGHYSLANVAPGRYRIHFFHERALPKTLAALSRDLVVTASAESLPSVLISEAGYLPAAHKNKYGQDYPPPADGAGEYPPQTR